MTPEERGSLREELAALNKAEEDLFEARKPFDKAIAAIGVSRSNLLTRHGVSDDYATCEECGEMIFDGDEMYAYEDGPTFCGKHAPTYAELRDHIQDCLKADADLTPEEISDLNTALAAFETHVAVGGLWDDKFTYPR